MAQSPTNAVEFSEADNYLQSWASLASMILRGRSLSGNERHCAYLNMGPSAPGGGLRFADVSAATGLDLLDDGRALCTTDWDGDGDLDLWLTNRGSPRIRFLKNNLSNGRDLAWVAFSLEGKTCNRDAIGALLEFEIDGRKQTRVLRAGDAFLSQSSKRILFGLGTKASKDQTGRLMVRWPGGRAETFEDVAVNRTHRILQGSGEAKSLPGPATNIDLAASGEETPPTTGKARILLTNRIAAPKIDYVDFSGELGSYDPKETGGAPTLMTLWASWCTPCVAELADLSAHHKQLQAKGLKVFAINTEAVSEDGSRPDISDAKALVAKSKYPFIVGATDAKGLRQLTILHNQVIVLERPLPLPSSFLFDRHGRLAVIYKGPVSAEELLTDVDLLEAAPSVIAKEAFPFPVTGGMELFQLSDLHFAKAYQDGGYIEDARKIARKAIQAPPTGNSPADTAARARAWYYLGTLEQSQLDWNAAAEAYRKTIEFAPNQPLFKVSLGVVLWQSGKEEAADRFFAEAAQAGQKNPQLLNALGKAHLQIRRFPEAVTYLEEALALTPGDLNLALTTALAHEKAGDAGAAITSYRAIIKAHPDSLGAMNNLAWLLATHPVADWRDGKEALELAQTVNEESKFENPSTLDTLAAAQAETGDFEAAIKTIEKAIRLAHKSGSSELSKKLRENRNFYKEKKPNRRALE